MNKMIKNIKILEDTHRDLTMRKAAWACKTLDDTIKRLMRQDHDKPTKKA